MCRGIIGLVFDFFLYSTLCWNLGQTIRSVSMWFFAELLCFWLSRPMPVGMRFTPKAKRFRSAASRSQAEYITKINICPVFGQNSRIPYGRKSFKRISCFTNPCGAAHFPDGHFESQGSGQKISPERRSSSIATVASGSRTIPFFTQSSRTPDIPWA